MRTKLTAAVVIFNVVFVAIQVIAGITRSNPAPCSTTVLPPPEIQRVLQRASTTAIPTKPSGRR